MLGSDLTDMQQQSLGSIFDKKFDSDYIQLNQLNEALLFIYALTKDPDIHIKIANSITVSNLGEVGLLALNSPTIEDSINCLVKYCNNTLVSGAELKLEKNIDIGRLSFSIRTDYSVAVSFLSYYFLSFIDFVLSSMTYQQFEYSKLSILIKEKNFNFSLLQRFGYICVASNSNFLWEFQFSLSQLKTKSTHYHEQLYLSLKNKIYEQKNYNDQKRKVQDIIYSTLYDMGDIARINLTDVSRKLGLSPRTIQRKLSDEGISFTEIQQKAIYENGIRFLNNPSYSIKEIAYCLGFTSVQAFHRAFKRVSGITPAQYREKIN